MSQPIFPIVRKETPILNLVRSKVQGPMAPQAVPTPEELAMAKEFRVGIARKLGVPVESISDEKAAKWVANWARAFMKPQLWVQQGYMARLGEDLVGMISPLQAQHLGIETQTVMKAETRMPARGSDSEQSRRERFARSEISIQR